MKSGPRVLLILSLAASLVLSACEPNTASVAIHHPDEGEAVYGYLDVSVQATVVDPRSIKVWVDDGKRTRGPWLRIDTRTLDEGDHAVFTRSGRHRDRVDFTVIHDVPDPIPGTVNVYGDSLTVQLTDDKGATTLDQAAYGLPAGSKVEAMPGVEARDFLGIASAEATDGRAEVVVVALGTNDSMKGGWDPRDAKMFRKLLDVPSPSTCLAVVLPGYGPTLPGPVQDDIDAARSSLRTIAARDPDVVAVDAWQTEIDADPTVVRPSDQIHLNDEDGPAAFAAAEAARARVHERAYQVCHERVGEVGPMVRLFASLDGLA